jgi:hypothetical protein
MRLRIGLGPVGKVFGVLVCCMITFSALILAGADLSPIFELFPKLREIFPGIDQRTFDSPEVPVVFRILPLVIIGGCAVGLVHVLRYGARLDRTTVTVRNTFTTSRVDLAAAHRFWFSEKHEQRTIGSGNHVTHVVYSTPVLCARDRRGTTRIPLGYYGRQIPVSQRNALARAIAHGQTQRDPASAQQAAYAIAALTGRLPAWRA